MRATPFARELTRKLAQANDQDHSDGGQEGENEKRDRIQHTKCGLHCSALLRPSGLMQLYDIRVAYRGAWPTVPSALNATAGPICGERTGLAMPKKTTTPCPPHRVESASGGDE